MVSILQRIGIVLAIGVVFLFGFATTVYLSLRSPIVTVPDVVGKNRFEAENELQKAGLNFRVRATRPSRQVNPDTVMFQLPPAGQAVKAGQTVAVDIARVAKEGEAAEATAADESANTAANANSNANTSDNANANTASNGNNSNGNRNLNANKPNANVNIRPNVNANANSTINRATT